MKSSRLAILAALFAALTLASANFAAPATAPSTQAGVEGHLDFPEWAMKAYPDDIVRLMRFDRVKEAEALGNKKLAELAAQPDKTLELIQTIASQAHLYLALNRVKEADKLIKKGLALLNSGTVEGREKEMDIARAQMEDCQSSLASARGETDHAAEFARSSLERLQKDLPRDDVRVVDEHLEVERYKIHAADHAAVPSALRTFQRAINTYSTVLGTRECAPVADVYMTRGYYLLENVQNITQAEYCFQSALDIRKKIYGENSEVGNALQALALIASIKHDDEGAVKLLNEARAMTLKVIGEDDPDVAGIDVLTASAYDRMGKVKEAEKLLLKAISVYEKYQETKSDLADTLELLSNYYHAHDETEKGDAAHDRAEKLRAELQKQQDL